MIDSIDILVHPWWGLGFGSRYSERERIAWRKAGVVGSFVRKHDWNNEDPDKAYGNLLMWLWKRRVAHLATDPKSALAIVWSNHDDVRSLEEELAEYAQEQLGRRVIHDELLQMPSILYRRVQYYFEPQNGVTLRAYGELSYACVTSILCAAIRYFQAQGMPVHGHVVINELCGDTLTGKGEAYTQWRAEMEARP